MLNKIKHFIRNNKYFFKDAILNTAAFVIYICAQQIILFPILAKLVNSESYAKIIIFVSLMNVFCNVLGGQLGVTQQLQASVYVDKDAENDDFMLLMLYASIIIIVLFTVILFILKYDIISVMFLVLTTLISNFRLYIRYYFRFNNQYKRIILQNMLYFIGIGCGLLLFGIFRRPWMPLFLGELFAIIFTLFIIPKNRIHFKKSDQFRMTLRRYLGLGTADALTNALTLVDKLLIYPLLGAYNLAVYNAGTTTSKVSALVMNPLNEVILVRLSKTKVRGMASLLKAIILITFFISLALFIVVLPIIFALSYVLYHQYLQEICSMLVFLSAGCAIGTTSTFLKSFILRYAKPQQLTVCYTLNFLIIIIGGWLGAHFYSLSGFAIAMVIARAELWKSFVIVLMKSVSDEENHKQCV